MSRLDELKKQYPELNMSIFDIIKRMDTSKTYKYAQLMCKIFSKRFDPKVIFESERVDEGCNDYKSTLEYYGINIDDLTNKEIFSLRFITELFSTEHFEILKEFIELSEKNKIINKDITSYSNTEDLRGAISLSMLKELDKELERQAIKEYEDDLWLIVRPLTFAASAKYGSSTRWCTTYKNEKQYFEKYWRKGILVYFINKKTGYKVAGFKSLNENDKEFSFWSAEDSRVDFLDTNIDDYLFKTIKKIFSSNNTNKNLCSDELQEFVHKECGVEVIKLDHQVIANEIQLVDPQPLTIRFYNGDGIITTAEGNTTITTNTTAIPNYTTTTN